MEIKLKSLQCFIIKILKMIPLMHQEVTYDKKTGGNSLQIWIL